MKEYKFIDFEHAPQGTYSIRNRKDSANLGTLFYYGLWRKFVLKSNDSVIWSVDCLRDVIDFIENEIPKKK